MSGKPLKSNAEGPGRFALPSINGFVMGMAHMDDDPFPDLFITSDGYNPGTYFYTFERYSEDGVPVFSEGNRIEMPYEKECRGRSVLLE
ncbi:MAG TPA: VCBS repeat-containing protein, partial [Anseongella sp.]|nr:VCBS repeat-containing protein [Anseongella sp.]